MSKKLIVTGGTRQRELQLVGRLVFGRDPSCDMSYEDALLSRRHAEFIVAGDAVSVHDLGSRNGIYVNGQRTAERLLEPGDLVQIGPLRAEYVFDSTPVSIAPEQLDPEQTAILSGPTTAAAIAASHGSSPAPARQISPPDDDVTRMVSAPVLLAEPAPPAAQPLNGDDDRTVLIPGPGSVLAAARTAAAYAAPAAVRAPTDNAAATARPDAAHAPRSSLSVFASPAYQALTRFVFSQLLMMAAVVFAAAMLPFLSARWAVADPGGSASAGLLWLAVQGGAALAAAWLVTQRINRRISETMTAVEESRDRGV